MKNIHEVLADKKALLAKIQAQVDAIETTVALLDDTLDPPAVVAPTPRPFVAPEKPQDPNWAAAADRWKK